MSRTLTAKKRVDVAVGVVVHRVSGAELLLISKRHGNQHLSGFWEFPGGKIESNEAHETALARELQEELGIAVRSAEYLCQIDYDYAEKSVSLHTYVVTEFSGEAEGLEGQEVKWVHRDELSNFDFPPANTPIINRLLQR